MSDQPEAKTKTARQSSPRYPFISLKKALERAQEMRAVAGPSAARAADIRAAWGYGLKSSGGDQTIAALGYYGLLEDEGTGDARKLKLTADAFRYLRDERPEVRAELASRFALQPKAMMILHDMWKDDGIPPSDNIARSILKNDLNYSDWAAKELLEVYRDNLQFIRTATSDKSPVREAHEEQKKPDKPEDQPDPRQVKVGDYIQWVSNGLNQFEIPQKVVWVSAKDGFLRTQGQKTGIPMAEATVVEQPEQRPDRRASTPEDLSVLMTGGRLQITADVDLEGLERLKEILEKYEEILELTGGKKPS
jgi:hypothetical protein